MSDDAEAQERIPPMSPNALLAQWCVFMWPMKPPPISEQITSDQRDQITPDKRPLSWASA